MRKFKYFILIVFMLFINYVNVNAACSESIIDEASKVTIDKKTVTNIAEDEIYLQVQVKNITNNIYVNVTESEDNTSKNYYYKDTEKGLLKINSYYLYEKIKWTAKIYSNSNECNGELLKTISIETPKYNEYHSSEECKKLYVFKYCDYFSDTSNIDKKEFTRIMDEHYKKINQTSMDRFIKTIAKYYLYVLTPIILVGGIYIIKIIKLKRSMKK